MSGRVWWRRSIGVLGSRWQVAPAPEKAVHFCPPGFALLQELELLVDAGIPPAGALSAATLHNARALHQSHDLGSIEPGKIADLVLLDANPLTDIRNSRRISLVIRGGIVCEPDKLLKLVTTE